MMCTELVTEEIADLFFYLEDKADHIAIFSEMMEVLMRQTFSGMQKIGDSIKVRRPNRCQ